MLKIFTQKFVPYCKNVNISKVLSYEKMYLLGSTIYMYIRIISNGLPISQLIIHYLSYKNTYISPFVCVCIMIMAATTASIIIIDVELSQAFTRVETS